MQINAVLKRIVEDLKSLAHGKDFTALVERARQIRADNPNHTVIGDLCNRFINLALEKADGTFIGNPRAAMNLCDELLPPDGSVPPTIMQHVHGASTSPHPGHIGPPSGGAETLEAGAARKKAKPPLMLPAKPPLKPTPAVVPRTPPKPPLHSHDEK